MVQLGLVAHGVGEQGVGVVQKGLDLGRNGVELGALAHHLDRRPAVQQPDSTGKNLVPQLQLRPVGLFGLRQTQMDLVAQPQKLAFELKREGGDGVCLQARGVFHRLGLAHKKRHHDGQADRHDERGQGQPKNETAATNGPVQTGRNAHSITSIDRNCQIERS